MRVLLVVYDNESYVSMFPIGLAYIAAVMRKAGHSVEIYNQDVYHWPESHLQRLLDHEKFDVVGVSVIGGYWQYRKLLKLSEAINRSKNRPFYILGGHGPAPEPAYFMKKTQADVIVIGEGERTALEILEAIEGKRSIESVKGIAFSDKGVCVETERRPLINPIDGIDFPAWDMFPMDHYSLLRSFPGIENNERCFPMLSGRGCIFECNFCYRMDKGFRPRSPRSIIEEIGILHDNYGITCIDFQDELLMSSEKRTADLCTEIIASGLKLKWACNGRLNFAKLSVLKLMKEAGCVFVNYGIESLDQKTLNVMNKGLTVRMIHRGVQETLDAGLNPGLNIIFGNIGETVEALRLGVDFLLKYDPHAYMRTIRPVTPYPGSPLYYYAIEKGFLKDCEDFYENKHVNSDLLSVNFSDLSDKEFNEALFEANKKLIEAYYKASCERTIEKARLLYFGGDVSFRGFRQL